MFPEIFTIPYINFTLSTYGLTLAIGFSSGLLLAARLASTKGYDRAKVYDIGIYLLIAVLIGSKLLMVVTEWQEFAERPSRIFSIDFLRSGGVYYGGFLGAVAASIYLARRYKMDWWVLADACAPAIALGQFFGRLGCFAAGCCWGKATDSWLGVEFTARAHELTGVPIGVRLHPTQLYEAGLALVLTASLLIMFKRKHFDGAVILTYVMAYSVGRFLIEFYRDDPRGNLFGLSTSQLISLLLSAVGATSIAYLWKKNSSKK
ncbi:MAG: prolipoprotein diacylglyceryl transferase [Acidobacteriota bacterium]|nr:prolipoprotein diacylglyceryl transferase [Blastocatellia bacterium]MDW8412860.1 prolipoprotein diacylglyceryl transferase [Acidobacteriota bacterium]